MPATPTKSEEPREAAGQYLLRTGITDLFEVSVLMVQGMAVTTGLPPMGYMSEYMDLLYRVVEQHKHRQVWAQDTYFVKYKKLQAVLVQSFPALMPCPKCAYLYGCSAPMHNAFTSWPRGQGVLS